MKLCTVLFILALLSFLSLSVGGWFHYKSMKEFALNDFQHEMTAQTKIVADHIATHLDEYQKTVKVLAGLNELQTALLRSDEAALGKANSILDHFHEVLKVDDGYLMDTRGNTIASSNRKAPDSFIGKNYFFQDPWEKSSAIIVSEGRKPITDGFNLIISHLDSPC